MSIHLLTQYLHQHPHFGGLIVFIIAFTESLAIVGSLIPGSVIMTAIGVLIGSNILPVKSTLIWAIAGAFSGDLVSYWIGSHFDKRLPYIWPFRKYPEWLGKGKKFIDQHGGKSIIIGRFVGPMRSTIPMVAGLLRLSPWRFIVAALPSAILWAIVYMAPGILLGALSLELPPKLATEFIVAVILFITAVWLLTWIIKLMIIKIGKQVDQKVSRLWFYLRTHHSTHFITRLLSDPQRPNNHIQLFRALAAIIFVLLFILFYYATITQNFLTDWNQPIFHLLRSFRGVYLDKIIMCFNMIANKTALFITAAIILITLILKRFWREALHWSMLVILSAVSLLFAKMIYFSPRPGGLLKGPMTSSFPSGHVTLSVALLGFLAILMTAEWPQKNRKTIYYVTATLLLGIAMARLYFGAHWLTDVLGGGCLGLFWVMVITISYRCTISQTSTSKTISILAPIALLVGSLVYSTLAYHKTLFNYQIYYPQYFTSEMNWWQQRGIKIALYGESRLGKPNRPLNIEWLGSLQQIRNSLKNQGWQQRRTGWDWRQWITKDHQRLPLVPKLFLNSPPVLVMIKTLSDNRMLVLQLWNANLIIKDIKSHLWVGTVHFYLSKHKLLTLHHNVQNQYLFNGVILQFKKDLKGWQTKISFIPHSRQPKAMRYLHWDGQLLLIKPNTIK